MRVGLPAIASMLGLALNFIFAFACVFSGQWLDLPEPDLLFCEIDSTLLSSLWKLRGKISLPGLVLGGMGLTLVVFSCLMSSAKPQGGCINLHLGLCHSFTSLLLCYMSLDRGSLAICLQLVASGLTVGRDLISSWFEIIWDHQLCFGFSAKFHEEWAWCLHVCFFPAWTEKWLIRSLHCGNKFSMCAEWREYVCAGWAERDNILIELYVPFFIMPRGNGYALGTPGCN